MTGENGKLEAALGEYTIEEGEARESVENFFLESFGDSSRISGVNGVDAVCERECKRSPGLDCG